MSSPRKCCGVHAALAFGLLVLCAPVSASASEVSAEHSPPELNGDQVDCLEPGAVASRSLGSLANTFRGRAVLQFPPAGDPPPNIKPHLWEAIFFPRPIAIAPGLCREIQLAVEVRSSVDVPPDQPDPPRRATKAETVLAYRVVEPFTTGGRWSADDQHRVQTACDNLDPVRGFFLLGQRLSAGSGAHLPTGQLAFRSDSDAAAAQGALLLQHAIVAARGGAVLPFSASCATPGSTHCTDPRKFLQALSISELAEVRNDHCGADDATSQCLTIWVQISGLDCALLTTLSAPSTELARNISIKCDERDFTRYPWYLERYFAPTILTVQ